MTCPLVATVLGWLGADPEDNSTMQVAAACFWGWVLQGNQPAAAPSFALGLPKAHLSGKPEAQ